MRFLTQMAVPLPIVPRDGVAPCYGRLNLHTNAREYGHRIHERSSGTDLPQWAALLTPPKRDIVDDLQLIHAIT